MLPKTSTQRQTDQDGSDARRHQRSGTSSRLSDGGGGDDLFRLDASLNQASGRPKKCCHVILRAVPFDFARDTKTVSKTVSIAESETVKFR